MCRRFPSPPSKCKMQTTIICVGKEPIQFFKLGQKPERFSDYGYRAPVQIQITEIGNEKTIESFMFLLLPLNSNANPFISKSGRKTGEIPPSDKSHFMESVE